jgi:hypothetical protein
MSQTIVIAIKINPKTADQKGENVQSKSNGAQNKLTSPICNIYIAANCWALNQWILLFRER